ncbi:hypothetical protein OpiT1DRAFT_05868 [Opitutaceae bacterium TAV1]|nr:hypothetical protein OpiT1DRAFT_05868 [Opitutaceae bacterium TAV1]
MTQTPTPKNNEQKKLQVHEHIVAALPLALVAVGGLIGGLFGGGAYAISSSIFKKDISTTKKYTYSILVSSGAVIAYFGCIIILAILFPGLFKRQEGA